jgi:hypothetical protein
VEAGRSTSSGSIQVLRGGTYFLALLVVGLGALLAFVDSTSPAVNRIAYIAFGLVIATVLVLLVQQPIGRITVASVLLLVLAYIVPAVFVHETFHSTGCIQGVPCDPAPNLHEGIRFGLAAALLVASLVGAAAGQIRSSRSREGAIFPAH